MLLTDLTDRVIAYSSGWHILSCPDKGLREKINETLFPIYRGKLKYDPFSNYLRVSMMRSWVDCHVPLSNPN